MKGSWQQVSQAVSAEGQRGHDYMDSVNRANEWNQFSENLQKIQQYKAKKEQLQKAQDVLGQLGSDPTNPLADSYKLSALAINPITGEGMSEIGKIAAYPKEIYKQKLYAQAVSNRLQQTQNFNAATNEYNKNNAAYTNETTDIVKNLDPKALSSTLFPEEFASVNTEYATATTPEAKAAAKAKIAALAEKAIKSAPSAESQMLAMRASRHGVRIPIGLEGANFGTAMPSSGFGVAPRSMESESLLGAPDPSQLQGHPALQPPVFRGAQSAIPPSQFGYDTSGGDPQAPWPY